MPWFDRTPSTEDYEFWKWERFNGVRLVGKWPHPNTPRIDPRFRLAHSRPTLIPQASRWGVVYYVRTLDYDPAFSDRNGIGWFDFESRGDNRIGVDTGPTFEGYDFEINLTAKDPLDVMDFPGVEYDVIITHPTFGVMHQTGEWADDDTQIHWRYNMNTNFWHGLGRWVHFEADPAWPFDLEIDIWAVNECFPFVQSDVGFAAMNGTDAYIALTRPIAQTNNPFVVQADIQWNSVTEQPFFGIGGTGGFGGMRVNDDMTWGNLRRPTTFTPTLGQWYAWRLEFEQNGQLRYDMFIDGGNIWGQVTNRQFLNFNRLGVYKQGVGGALWSDILMRDLKWFTGAAPSTFVELDMPLRANALDLSVGANHGTTFNMDLPSV